MELFVGELEDGRLNMGEVFMTGGDAPDRITPHFRGQIEHEPAYFQVVPVNTFISGEAAIGVPEKYVVRP